MEDPSPGESSYFSRRSQISNSFKASRSEAEDILLTYIPPWKQQAPEAPSLLRIRILRPISNTHKYRQLAGKQILPFLYAALEGQEDLFKVCISKDQKLVSVEQESTKLTLPLSDPAFLTDNCIIL